MQIAKELAGFSGAKARRPAQGDRQEEPRGDGEAEPEFVAGARASGTSDAVIDFIWSTNEKSADYSFNRSHAACYGLIAYRTAVAEGQPPRRVHGGADLLRDVDQGPRPVLRPPVARTWEIEILPPDVNSPTTSSRSVERADPLRLGRR